MQINANRIGENMKSKDGVGARRCMVGSGALEWKYMSYVFLNNHLVELRFWFWSSWWLKQKGKLAVIWITLFIREAHAISLKERKKFLTLCEEKEVMHCMFKKRCQWIKFSTTYTLGIISASELPMCQPQCEPRMYAIRKKDFRN